MQINAYYACKSMHIFIIIFKLILADVLTADAGECIICFDDMSKGILMLLAFCYIFMWIIASI